MVANVIVREVNGGKDGWPGTETQVDGQGVNDGTDVRYCTTDAYNPGSNYPCVVPSSGTNYSYWKHHYLNISGTFTKVNNIRWYTDGTIGWTCGTDGGLFVGIRDSGDNGVPMPTNYEVATGTANIPAQSLLAKFMEFCPHAVSGIGLCYLSAARKTLCKKSSAADATYTPLFGLF